MAKNETLLFMDIGANRIDPSTVRSIARHLERNRNAHSNHCQSLRNLELEEQAKRREKDAEQAMERKSRETQQWLDDRKTLRTEKRDQLQQEAEGKRRTEEDARHQAWLDKKKKQEEALAKKSKKGKKGKKE